MTTLDQFNRLDSAAATELILRCCASACWARRMVEARPYRSLGQLTEAADEHWRAMRRRDFIEAFQGHPKIGRPDSGGAHGGAGDRTAGDMAAGDMAAEEQSGVAGASAEVIESLARHNHDYEEKFGFIFIVCATGKSAAQMLELIRERIGNDRAGEIANAAEEQRKITQIRIRKMFALSE